MRMKTYYKFRTQYRPSGIVLNEDACENLKRFNESDSDVSKLFSPAHVLNVPDEYRGMTCPIKVMIYEFK